MPRPDSFGVAVLLTSLVAFGPLSTDLYLPSLPMLVGEFATDIPTVQLTLSVFLLGFAVSQLAYGPLSDRFGRRPVLLAGVALYAVASIACTRADSIETLILLRFLQAVGACVGPVVARAVVRDVYGRERAARVLSYMAMAMAIAPAVGPLLGGVLTERLGWRACFVALSAIGVAVLLAVWLFLRETNVHRDPEALRPARLLNNYQRLFSHRAYLGYVLCAACMYSGLFAFISGSSFVLMNILGLTPTGFGLGFAAAVVGYMLGSFSSGRLTLALGIDRMIVIGTAVSTLAGLTALGLALAGQVSVVAVIAPVVVYFLGTGITLSNALAGAVGPFPSMAGLASALLGFIQMSVAAGVGIVVGHSVATDQTPMMLAIALTGAGALLAHRFLALPTAPAD